VEKVETLGKRLQQLMEERDLNYDRLGRLLDMKPQTLNRYVLGQREPKARVATEMAMRLEVNPLWLQGYDVPRRSAPGGEASGGRMVPVLAHYDPDLPLHRQHAQYYLPAQVSDPENCFFLAAPDESMSWAGIRRGDLILIRSQSMARSGQLVLCTMDSLPPALRRFHLQSGWAIVQAEAPGAIPRMYERSQLESGPLKLLGVALSLQRSLE
jgi:repressor LexA